MSSKALGRMRTLPEAQALELRAQRSESVFLSRVATLSAVAKNLAELGETDHAKKLAGFVGRRVDEYVDAVEKDLAEDPTLNDDEAEAPRLA